MAHVQVTDSAFYHELASGGSVGAAESWVRGHWKTPDLLKVMQLMAANIDLLNAIDDRSSALERVALRALHLLTATARPARGAISRRTTISATRCSRCSSTRP